MGNTSLELWEALTWSLGCTEPGSPSRSDASEAITSLAFMFDEVPEPVWNTSMGNSSSQTPSATSSAASTMAAATAAVHLGHVAQRGVDLGRLRLHQAEGPDQPAVDAPPEIGKFSTARWVWAP